MVLHATNPTQEEIAKALEPPTPQEIIQAQDVEIRKQAHNAQKYQRTAATLANILCCVIYMLQEKEEGPRTEVTIPLSLRRKMDNAELKLRWSDTSTSYVSYVERADDVVFDGRPDG